MSTLAKKINIEKIADILFSFYIIMAFLSERTILGRSSMVAYVLLIIIMVIIRGKVKFSWYLLFELLFITYSIFQIYSGISVDKRAALQMVETLLICSIIYMCVYHYSWFKKDYMHVFKIFFHSNVWALLINMLIDINTLFSSRTGAGLEIGGIKIGGAISISVGWMAGVCLVLAVFLFSKDREKKFWLYFLFFSFVILTSGTRKALLFIPLALIGWFYYSKYPRNVYILIKYSILIFAFIILGYFIIINNNLLYEAIGQRAQNVIKYIFASENQIIQDGSLDMRFILVDRAKESIRHRPYFGWGLDNFSTVVNGISGGELYTHNNYLEILVSGGIIGFTLYFIKYLYVISSLLSIRKYAASDNKIKTDILLLLIFGIIFLEYWQVTYFTRKFMIVWILILSFVDNIKHERNVIKTKVRGVS